MQKRLLTLAVAKKHSGLGERYPSCDIISMFQVEQAVMREKMGQTFYETLLELTDECGCEPPFSGTGDCIELYNTLWCDYLAQFLALHVHLSTMGLNLSETNGQGEVMKIGADFVPATKDSLARKYDAINTLIHSVYANMDTWIKKNNETGCFDDYIGLADCCSTCYRIECDCTCSKTESKILAQSGWYLTP